MFQLMIADDNPYIIEELCNVIDWEDFDMCIAGTFPNGQALLEAAEKICRMWCLRISPCRCWTGSVLLVRCAGFRET